MKQLKIPHKKHIDEIVRYDRKAGIFYWKVNDLYGKIEGQQACYFDPVKRKRMIRIISKVYPAELIARLYNLRLS